MRLRFIGPVLAAVICAFSAGPSFSQTIPTGAAAAKYDAEFNTWLKKEIWPEARKAGISQKTLEATLMGLSINWKLPDLIIPGQKPPKDQAQSQAEFSSPGAYFSEQRLQGLAATGRSLAATHAATLKRIEATYGVPGNILIAVWGRESGFGRAKLPNVVIDVLATKAYTSTRKEMFRMELIDALKIVESGDIPASKMMGSWAGALGQPQFMPSSYLKYAVDFDGDGHRDIWNSVPDALASIANYLSKRGWQRNRDWGFEVSIPGDVSCAQEGPDLARPVADWAKLGITRISGKGFPANDLSADGMMLVPAGRNGPEFVVTPNFYVIKEYNNSDLYALFIGNLADRIAYGAGPFQGKWGDVGSMLRSDVLSMQKALVAKGYDVGKADGLAGFKTRRSLGDWQAKNGMRPTCFPDASLKTKLR
ncbi:lytic murein transglycosylase [Agrobacterium rosae]|uniref:Lytic murein transglycosylase n=1 Tax=Agrobacterium rosae TaxID=1972867 RepID=A0AAE5S1G3_9HYPH|nr:lytic murein transglycosylase [Agrobacterium rosae]KAA3511093.1 lytic murein transglycosylase [Agrobacterium rosae]KAA3518131.1 lytic murein transglycosylase [Agrobacterium rosae]MCM2434435.1 lytic murein transglycosylase [Agrobacterium rosae]MDX8329297.1 lytic murein transglycosylase [Agrobacterium rosae]MQB49717.1 lytic murein transglycosylase [Agrobacterium rosae]